MGGSSPVLIAAYLSRTGCYEHAQIMSSMALAVLIVSIGLATGGITSFAAVWLVLIPLEAALAASRRVVMFASAIALAAAGMLYFAAEPDIAWHRRRC
jgi:cell cycle sensor histidine kinase DivJ